MHIPDLLMSSDTECDPAQYFVDLYIVIAFVQVATYLQQAASWLLSIMHRGGTACYPLLLRASVPD